MGSYIFYSSHLTAGEGHLVPIEQRGSLGPTYKKVNCTLVQALRLCTGHTAHRGSRGIAHSFLTTALEGSEGSVSRPSCSLPSGKTRYLLYRRLGGPQGWSGQVQKISPPPGFDRWTVQPAASRYTNYATQPTPYVKP